MILSRRDLFESILAAGVVAGLLEGAEAPPLTAEPLFQAVVPGQRALPEYDSHSYWSDFYAPAPARGKGNSQALKSKLTPTEREAQFLYVGNDGLHYASDLTADQLPDYSGDVAVTMTLGQFRAGDGDQSFLKSAQGAQFRVDCTQTKPYLQILAPLAWCAIASIKPNAAGQLPSLQSLGFESPNATSGVTKILLTQGSGKMAVNVYYTKGTSMLQKVLKDSFEVLEGVAPVMNFPAASVVAMKTFSLVLGKLEERAAFLMNSSLTDVVASKTALQAPDRAVNYLPLISGEYVLVPTAHAPQLKPNFSTLALEQGYLVDKNASKSDPLKTRADQTVPGVTYASLKISVSEAPVSSASGESGSGEESGSKSKPKTASKKQ